MAQSDRAVVKVQSIRLSLPFEVNDARRSCQTVVNFKLAKIAKGSETSAVYTVSLGSVFHMFYRVWLKSLAN